MIKEYFTDGLIGLAILLSLLRTDLIHLNVNNLIDYPEVQEIILGQTAAYLPASFHNNIENFHNLANTKHLEIDYPAFNFHSLIQNANNLAWIPPNIENDIEAFLVSGTESSQHEFHPPTNANSQSSGLVSPTLPSESANSFTPVVSNNTEILINGTESHEHNSNMTTDNLAFLNFDSPFPGCNLTKEDIDLIDILWRQDVDLGIGKEVFDPTLREEIEREKELENAKQLEMQKAQLAAKEKEEQEKKLQAGKWLRQNFIRDGETGEWIRVQNDTPSGINQSAQIPLASSSSNSDDFQTLEAALDYISQNVDTSLLDSLETNTDNSVFSDDISLYQPENVENLQQPQQYDNLFVGPSEEVEAQQELISQQEDLGDNWDSLVNYLNMAANETETGLNNSQQESFLLQNATLPSNNLELGSLTPMDNFDSVLSHTPENLNSSMDWDMDNLNIFNLTSVDNVDDLGLQEVDNFLLNLENDLDDPNQTNLGEANFSMGNASPEQEFSDAFDGLEGAIGGSDFTSSGTDGGMMGGPSSKISRLSESSNDSGFPYQGDFSSGGSAPSSYAGSPSTSNNCNSSSASNDTEHDPHGSRTLAQQVAHNHTYNTLPGHTPREVKKYAHKEPARKGPQSRDHRKAQEMRIPFTVEQIISSPVETFNDLLTKHKLTEAQLTLVRDIRRRGKNKVAAQNCRKRKVVVIESLSDEMVDLQKFRDRLIAERAEMERETRKMKEKFGQLYTHIFQSLRNEQGEPYDPNLYSLQQSSDGNVFLVPRNLTNGASGSSTSSTKDTPTRRNTSQKKRKASDE